MSLNRADTKRVSAPGRWNGPHEGRAEWILPRSERWRDDLSGGDERPRGRHQTRAVDLAWGRRLAHSASSPPMHSSKKNVATFPGGILPSTRPWENADGSRSRPSTAIAMDAGADHCLPRKPPSS